MGASSPSSASRFDVVDVVVVVAETPLESFVDVVVVGVTKGLMTNDDDDNDDDEELTTTLLAAAGMTVKSLTLGKREKE